MAKFVKGPSLFLTLVKTAGNGYLLLGVLFFVLALVAYAVALSKINLSIAYPIMTSLGFLIVISFSFLYLHEAVTFFHWLGLLLIITGVFLIAQSINY